MPELNSALSRVFGDARDLLYAFSGPESGFASVLTNTQDGRTDVKFTRDGINILSAVEYANPIDQHLLSTLQYIGRGMEKAAGDGTTSSMIVMTKFVELLRDNKSESLNPISYREFNDLYNVLETEIINELDAIAIKPDTNDKELLSIVSFNQAMTSSHGNVELSNIVSDLVTSLPIKALDSLTYRREYVETDDIYKVEINDADFYTECGPMDQRMYNTTIGSGIEFDSATIMVPDDNLIEGSESMVKILTRIGEMTKENGPLVLLIPPVSNNVGRILQEAYTNARKEGLELVILYMHINEANRCTPLNAIFAMRGLDNMAAPQGCMLIENVRVKYEHDMIHLYGIVEYGDDKIHPGITDPSSAISKFLFVLDDTIEMYRVSHNVNSKHSVMRLNEIRNMVEFSGVGRIVIGGPLYESSAAQDIIEDVLVAARESVVSGCVLGGYRSLHKALSNIENKSFLAKILMECIEEYNDKLLGWCFENTSIKDYNLSLDLDTKTEVEFTKHSLLDEQPMILQSVTSYVEFLKRMGDIVPKLVYMTRLVIPNAINDIKEIE